MYPFFGVLIVLVPFLLSVYCISFEVIYFVFVELMTGTKYNLVLSDSI